MNMLFVPILLLLLSVVPAHGAQAEAVPSSAANEVSAPTTLWAVRCGEPQDASRHCEIFQSLALKGKEDGAVQRLAEMAVGFLREPPKKRNFWSAPPVARAVLTLPLGVMVNAPLKVTVDKQKPLSASIRHCESVGCYALMDLTEKQLTGLAKGEKILIEGQIANGQTLHIVMGLRGFAAGLTQIRP